MVNVGIDSNRTRERSAELLRDAQGHVASEEDPAVPPRDPQDTSHSRDDLAGSDVQEHDDELGDIDLIDHLLHDGPEVNRLSVRIVAARSGIAGVGWVGQESAIPAGHKAVALQYMGRAFGYLHAPEDADDSNLAGWAAWMARWAALEHKHRMIWKQSMTDELTGAWNRRYFDNTLRQLIGRATTERFRVTLMVFDIDDFKSYNDRFGHSAGDDILRETARLMQTVVREHDIVARIGGDEFAVIFWDAEGPRRPNSKHPSDVRRAAERFQRAICETTFPKLLHHAPGSLTISGGLAGFPWDGRTAEDLLERADQMAMLSKQQGKNALRFGPGANVGV